MSASASEPIGINFSGQSSGSVVVDSNAPVIVDGQITNPNGNTTIDSSGSITVTPNGSISSENLTLIAAGGIGTSIAAVPITIDGGFLDAVDGSTNGIYLNLASGATIGAIAAGNGPTYGNVVIEAAGSLLPRELRQHDHRRQHHARHDRRLDRLRRGRAEDRRAPGLHVRR